MKHESIAHIQRSPVSASYLEGVIVSLRGGERIPSVPVASQEEALSTGKARGTPGSCHHSRVPQMSQSMLSLHCLDFQAEDRLTQRWHVGQPSGKASWESLEGRPRGKATHPLIHAKGIVTLPLQLGRKSYLHAPNGDED